MELNLLLDDSITSRKRAFHFLLDMPSILVGDLVHDAVESQALQLLSDIASAIAGLESEAIPALIFIAYDFGALVLKKAIAIAAANEAQWPNIFFRTVQFVFVSCFQRRRNYQEFDSKIWAFLQETMLRIDSSSWAPLIVPFCSTRNLADVAVEMTEAFLNSRITLRTPVVSIFDCEPIGKGDAIFDFFTASLGLSTESVVQRPHGRYRPVTDLKMFICDRSLSWVYNSQWTALQRMLLPLASPQHRQQNEKPEASSIILQSKPYKDWIGSTKSPILYIQGENEDHSRFLAEQVSLNWQWQLIRRQKHNRPVLSFSFSSHDPTRSTINSMICSAAIQVREAISGILDSTWNILLDLHRFQRGWTNEDLHNIFLVTASWAFEQGGLIVLHDLDECDAASRKAFLDLLQDEITECDSYAKVVVVSRRRLSLLGDSEKSDMWNVYDSSEDSSRCPLLLYPREKWLDNTVSQLCPGGHGQVRIRKSLQALGSMDQSVLENVLCLIQDHTKWPDHPTARALSGFCALSEQITVGTSPAAMLNTILRSIPDQSGLRWALQWVIYGHRPLSGAELALLFCHWNRDNGYQFSPGPTADDLETALKHLKAWLSALVHSGPGRIRVRNTVWDILSDDNPDYIWNEIKSTAHYKMLDFTLAYLASAGSRGRLEEVYEKYRVEYNTDDDHLVPSVVPDGEDLLFYAVTAFPYHLERGFQTQKHLENIFESFADPLIHWARMYWTMCNPFSRPPIETADSPFSILLNDLGLDSSFRKELKRAMAVVIGSPTAPSDPSESAAMGALVRAISAGNEDNALKHIRRVLSNRPHDENKTEDDRKSNRNFLSKLVWRATWLGMDRLLNVLLEAGASPDPEDVKSARYPSPLFMACVFGKTEVVKVLLKAGGNSRVLRNDDNLLLSATGNAHSDIAQVLISHDKGLLEMEQTNTPLWEASRFGGWKAAKTLFGFGAKSDLDVDYNGWVPLTVAADDGYSRTVRTLLENGADPNSPGPLGVDTALWPAIMNGQNIECVQALLEYGADPNHERFSRPLVVDICSSATLSTEYKLAVLNLLVTNTPSLDIDRVDAKGSSGLMFACSSACGDEAVVDWLLAHNADVSLVNDEQRGAIHYSATNGYQSIIKKLLERKPPLNTLTTLGETLLQISVRHGADQVGLFLDAGVDPYLQNNQGITVFNHAVIEEKVDVVELLIERKVDVNRRDHTGWLPIHDACGDRPNIEILRLLHDAGARLLEPNEVGNSPLHLAGDAGRPEKVAALLEYRGAIDIEQRNNEGETPLIKAARKGNIECIRRLLDAGADINAQCSDGMTPLMSAICVYDPVAAVEFLLSQPGIDISLVSRAQGSALHMACEYLEITVMQKLLDHGADINKNILGLRPTPFMAACMPSVVDEADTRSEFCDKTDRAVRALVSRGADVHVRFDTPISTPLCAAAQVAGPSAINYLISEGLSLKQAGCLGRLPIHYAAVNGRENFETVFQSVSDLLTVDKAGKNALHWAAQFGHVETVENILSHAQSAEERKKRVNQADIDGWTALCWALRPHISTYEKMFSEPIDQMRTVQALLEDGANAGLRVRMGAEDEMFTVLELAQLHGASEEIMHLLNEAVEARPSVDDDTPRSIRPYKEAGYDCDICSGSIWGPCWECEICPDFDICKKCFGRIDLYHGHKKKEDGEPHVFRLIVESDPEVRDGPPSPDYVRKGSDERGGNEGDSSLADETMDAIMDFDVDDIPDDPGSNDA
ncbi:ankyrin repeat-containing domain protein [Aspergillus unguis]